MNFKEIESGSATSPRGFRAAGVTAGLKPSGQPDLALLVSDAPAAAAGAFTSNLFAAAPVKAGVPADYALNHLVCSFVETVRWWSRNRVYGPEEVCSFFCATSLPVA